MHIKTLFTIIALITLMTSRNLLYAGDPDPLFDTSNPTYNTYVDVTSAAFAGGATGNGNASYAATNTAAINAAIEALGTNGGTVFFPKGTYYLEASGWFAYTTGGGI